ncbi:PFAM peptidase S9 prolyl oligopeptidase active site domain protein, partial [Desmophyllum pertusum]
MWDTTDGAKSYGYYYPPLNKEYQGPEDEQPPLLVKGFAVLDVNYRGSSGYGREYRDALKKKWGISDIEDCCSGAQFLADTGKADPARLLIDGGSAGGFAALAALTFHKVFSAGTSFYGISDLVTLAMDTHKFESRYLDTLIGPYPQDEEIYKARSPINHTGQLDCALALFQGSEDKVCPPDQSIKMYEAVRDKGRPVVYKEFE